MGIRSAIGTGVGVKVRRDGRESISCGDGVTLGDAVAVRVALGEGGAAKGNADCRWAMVVAHRKPPAITM